MTIDDVYADLPDDDELAFISLEKHYRADLEKKIQDDGPEGNAYRYYYQEYINLTLAAARECNITYFEQYEAPLSERQIYDVYRAFSLEVAHFAARVSIRHSRRDRRYSVALDNATKAKIKHHLSQLKEIADSLDVPVAKREAILSKILALEMEMARERTRFEVIAALFLETATVAGKVGDKLEPWRRLIDSVGNLLGLAKDRDTYNPSLPAPEERKRLERPKHRLPSPPPDDSHPPHTIDDDIPF